MCDTLIFSIIFNACLNPVMTASHRWTSSAQSRPAHFSGMRPQAVLRFPRGHSPKRTLSQSAPRGVVTASGEQAVLCKVMTLTLRTRRACKSFDYDSYLNNYLFGVGVELTGFILTIEHITRSVDYSCQITCCCQ